MSESITKRKGLVLIDISSNFIYYPPYNRSMMRPIILKPSCNILDTSNY